MPAWLQSWLQRQPAIYAARSAHEFCAGRIRQKLAYGTNTETLLDEAYEMVRRDTGWSPSGEDYDALPLNPKEYDPIQRQMGEIAAYNFEAMSETESYMWGLGIAGIFHLWERETRKVIVSLQKNPPNSEELDKLNNMRFKKLCEEVEKTDFAVTKHPAFPHLETASLITNTIKHGEGKAFRQLVAKKPELFRGGPVEVRMGILPAEPPHLQPQHLRLSEKDFNEVSTAIGKIWSDYEDAVTRRANK